MQPEHCQFENLHMLCLPHYIFGCTVFQTRLIYKVIVQYYISEVFLPVSVSIEGVQ